MKNQHTYWHFLLLLICLFACFLPAQYSSALTVSPVSYELTADPGQTLTKTILLRNEQKESKTFYFDVQSFEARDESGNPALFKSTEGLPSWITPETESLTLGAGQEQTITFHIHVPENAEPGGYFSAILFRNDPPKTLEQETTVNVGSQVGSLILLQVSGNLEEGANILEFNTKTKHHFFKSLPIDFYYRFQNSGETWTKPVGDIVIENMWGGTSKIIPANPEGGNILPRSIRRFESSWLSKKGEVEDPKSERINLPTKFWQRVAYEWKNSPLGRYTARLTLSYGAGNELRTSKSVTFWVLPWELLIVEIPSLLIFLILFFISMKRYNRYIIQKDRKKRTPTQRRTRTKPQNN